MEARIFPFELPARPCRFCLCLQGGSVFADFGVDEAGLVFLLRISFDGYGCCVAPATIGRMSAQDSGALLAMVDADAIDTDHATRVLTAYFRDNESCLWPDALRDHGLL